MNVKLTTVGMVVAAAMILVPYGASDADRVQVQPVVHAAAPVSSAEARVGKVIAAQGNTALVQIRAEIGQPIPPDLKQLAAIEQSE